MARCSIVIPVHDKASLTRQCLDALLASPREDVDFEIIVVDDASAEETRRLVAGYRDQIRVVTHASNTGFATSCNDGAAIATGEYLVFLNNDTMPTRGWLAALVRHADNHPRAAVVGSKLLFPDGTIQHAGMVICQDRFPRHIYTGFPADHPAVNRSRPYPSVTGACMLVRNALFGQVGGFDASYFNGFEDVDICLRLGVLGHEVHYCHESLLYHLESATRDGRSAEERRNAQLFQERWASRVQPDDLQYFVADGLLGVDYRGLYPLIFSISPLLAVVGGEGRERHADRLLQARTQQAYELLKENIRLNVRVGEVELRAQSGRRDAPDANGPLSQTRRPSGTNGEPLFGVNLAGFFGSEKGLGEAVRSTARSLDAADIPYNLNNYVDHGSLNEDDTYNDFTGLNGYQININQVNVDSIEDFYRARGKTYFEGRYNIGYWTWELSDFPEEWEPNFRHFDEIWVPSSFSLDSVARAAPIPVVRIPYSIGEHPEIGPSSRSQFDLPDNKYVFLYIFDFHSSLERKNPLGLVEAFARAFPAGGDATLVLKCSHSRDCPEDLAALVAAAEQADVRIIDRVMSRREVNTLLALADCYVSLHRSEGFGLTLAEAMSLGKPVIATAYSGNMDFMTPANSFLVSYELTKLEQDHGPYKKGSVWADPAPDHAAELMRHVFQNPHVARAVGRVARHDILRSFHPQVVGALIKHRLQKVAARRATLPAYCSLSESP